MFAACSRAPVCNFPMPYWDTAGSITVREGQQITQYILNIGIPRRPGKFPASCRGERAPPYLLLISSRGKLPWRMPSLCASPLCSSPLTHSRAHNNQRRSASSSLDRRRFLSFLDLLPAPAPLQQQQHISCRILGSASSLGLWGASCPSPPSSTRTATPGVAHLGPPSALVPYQTSLRIVASSLATTGASSSTRLLPGRIYATSRERLDS